MQVDLNGKVALVTGAARGIGKAIADTFAANGARVLYADIDRATAEAAAREQPDCRALTMDVTSDEQVERVIDEAVRDFIRVCRTTKSLRTIMQPLIVVDDVQEWPFDIPGVAVVEANKYLTTRAFADRPQIQLFNLCRSYRYQSTGYYVTLLATARGHRPLPDLTTIQDLKSRQMVRLLSDDLDELIQEALRPICSREFTLSIYFGHNPTKRYARLCRHLFELFQAPFVRARFMRPNGKWILRTVNPIAIDEIPKVHHRFVLKRTEAYFAGRRSRLPKRPPAKFDLAILTNPAEQACPSNPKALESFAGAAAEIGISTEVIGPEDLSRIAEFDALFIRETTNVNHHTYRFARSAASQGLVVIDDPESILKCTNKVYLAELLTRKKVPIPRTMVIHRNNVDAIEHVLGFPCILKVPDGAFSQGVFKVDDAAMACAKVKECLSRSELIIAQEFLETSFDWRIGICDRVALFACRYHMAENHWQIIRCDAKGQLRCGPVENVSLRKVPECVIATALRAADLIGDGLYGVDLKQIGSRAIVIEVNDNPNVDAGNEDAIMKDDLYRRIMAVFLSRIEQKKSEWDEHAPTGPLRRLTKPWPRIA